MFCYIDARVHKESRKFDARRLLDSAAQDAGPRLHLEGKLEDPLDLLGGEAGDLSDMAQGGGHFVAAVDPYGEFLQRPAQVGCAMLL